MAIQIVEGNIKSVIRLTAAIEEFHAPHQAAEYHKRLTNVPHLILIAYEDAEPVGFKVGYEREGYFYSWMGGVRKDWRRRGIAKALANRQEDWARQQGYTSVTFKTRNRLKAMLLFGLRNGFNIIGFEERPAVGENRILLKKEL